MKKVRFFDATTTILQGIGFLLIGIFILIDRETFLNLIVRGISITLVLIGLINSIKNIIVKENKAVFVNFLSSIANILAGAFIWYKPNLFISIFPLLFSIYVFIDAIIKTAIFVIYKRNNIEDRFAILIRSIITYIFSIIMLFYPFIRDTITFLLAGIYCILLSTTYIVSAVESYIPIKKMNKIKKKIRIALPIFIAAFIPYRALKEINEVFKPYRKNKTVEIEKENIEPDIEVLVHLREGLTASFGHVDLYYNGKVISYGSYDEANVILSSSIGDGVLFECDKEKYIDFCNNQIGKTIVGFGLKLTDNQKDAINKKIYDIKSTTYSWYPESKLKGKGKFKDYASRLYDATNASFYKFKSGKFKTFFVLNTNCVLLADELIGTCGVDILKISGLIAPGTYYEYFNREFKRKNSIVVSKRIYMSKNNELDEDIIK